MYALTSKPAGSVDEGIMIGCGGGNRAASLLSRLGNAAANGIGESGLSHTKR